MMSQTLFTEMQKQLDLQAARLNELEAQLAKERRHTRSLEADYQHAIEQLQKLSDKSQLHDNRHSRQAKQWMAQPVPGIQTA